MTSTPPRYIVLEGTADTSTRSQLRFESLADFEKLAKGSLGRVEISQDELSSRQVPPLVVFAETAAGWYDIGIRSKNGDLFSMNQEFADRYLPR